MAPYDYAPIEYVTPPELSGGTPKEAPVLIVGAGPIGLAAAVDLALSGVATVLVDDNNVVSVGSRAICWAKRSLEILDRLGVADRMLAKGVTWKLGRIYRRAREIYQFDLLPEEGHKFPAFINLQQYYMEQYLIERCRDFPGLIDLRFKNRLVGLSQDETGVTAELETEDGRYQLKAAYLLACDGARSLIRQQLGLEFGGTVFEERFLIADVVMDADFPSERWFWFNPDFHPGQSALLHKQPDNIYRIDLQLGPDADAEAERQPEKVIPRIEKIVGDRPFKLDWVSVYSFQCRRLEKFVHDRVIFAGDSAHIVSPFGARGGNGGLHDVDNLCWKLAAIVKREAGPDLLASYDEERIHGADENIRNSSWSTRFMSPEPGAETWFRDATLDLAERFGFARRLVNPGRLSVPCSLSDSALNSADQSGLATPMVPGSPCADAPIASPQGAEGWLLNQLGGRFVLLSLGQAWPGALPAGVEPLLIGEGGWQDTGGFVAARYGNGHYLIRPDQHIAARWQEADADALRAALQKAGIRQTEMV